MMSMRDVGLAAAILLGLATAPAAAETTLRVSHFPGSVWPIQVGMEQGYFAAEALKIELVPITSSVAQMTGIMENKVELGTTAMDNVIAYDVGQGEAPLKEKADLFVFMGGDGGSLHLMTAPEIKKVEDLKGKVLAVDAKTTGFAFVLYSIVAKHGLKASDYSLLAVGSSQKRLEALTSGQAQAALLNRPFDSMAAAKGANDLGAMNDTFPHYQSGVGMARRAWAKDHKAELIGFIRAYVKGSLWIFEPRNKDAAIANLLKNTPNLPPKTAEDIYNNTTGPGTVTSPTAALDETGIATVVALRETFGVPKKKLGNAKQFYDVTYYNAAVK